MFNQLFSALRRLSPGVALIAATSAFLLFSDTTERGPSKMPRVAIFQFSSVVLLDDGVKGVLDSLREHGYVAGRNIQIDRFNAQDDMPTAVSIGKEITSGRYDYVITVSTNCLQAVANANHAGRARHIFGVVADPVAAKVGVNPNNPLDHPPYMVGIGSLMPASEVMELARRFNPNIRRFGQPWNPSQANSLKFTQMAREAAPKMGVEVIDGAVDNTTMVAEVVASLVSRGADAILALGDLTVAMAMDSVIAEARKGRIPVFSVMPESALRGALMGAGPDWGILGRHLGDLAVRVIQGEDTAKMPIIYAVPKQYAINLTALDGLRGHWAAPPDLLAKANTIIDSTGVHQNKH